MGEGKERDQKEKNRRMAVVGEEVVETCDDKKGQTTVYDQPTFC